MSGIQLSDITTIEIEQKTVTLKNKEGVCIASTTYDTKERAIEVANDIWNKKVKLSNR